MNLFNVDFNSSDIFLFAIAGTGLGWFVIHKLTAGRDKRNRFVAACGKFRTDIWTSFLGLYPSPVNWPNEKIAIIKILETKFPTLQASVAEFRSYLPFWKKCLFDMAWRRYLNGKWWGEGTLQDYWQYIPHHGEGVRRNGKHYSNDNRLTYHDDFKRNVSRLLSFAKEN